MAARADFNFGKMALATVMSLAAAAIIAYGGVIAWLYTHQTAMEYENVAAVEVPAIRSLAIQDVRIRTPDGETLQAWYEPPRPGMPVFLFLHGQGATQADGKWRFLRMHQEGVGYLALAYRGFSGSTGKPSEKGLFIDGLAAYDWLKAQGFGDSDIVIHGHSLGTGVATYVATQRPARALILEAPFTGAVDVAKERYPYMPVDLLMRDKFLNRARIRGRAHARADRARHPATPSCPTPKAKHFTTWPTNPRPSCACKAPTTAP
ncbi:MAG: alpha/beta fold hydrolase [Asticcacaulis sp.]